MKTSKLNFEVMNKTSKSKRMHGLKQQTHEKSSGLNRRHALMLDAMWDTGGQRHMGKSYDKNKM